MQNPLRASRTRIAAVAAAVLFGAGAGAAVVTALDSDQNAPQVSASRGCEPDRDVDLDRGRDLRALRGRRGRDHRRLRRRRLARRRRRHQAQGSGFVYDEQGHIITNQHVVDGAESVSVRFSDGSTHDATVVGSDPSTDLAVLKVDAPRLASGAAPARQVLRARGR